VSEAPYYDKAAGKWQVASICYLTPSEKLRTALARRRGANTTGHWRGIEHSSWVLAKLPSLGVMLNL
jgi:hypothetical protein